MSLVPQHLRYTASHEWVRPESDGSVTVGITDHAQHALGDIVFVDVPPCGRSIAAGEACAVVESVKAASDVYAPLSGRVGQPNESLAAAPELVNQDPYGQGWLYRLEGVDAAALAALLTAQAYAAQLAAAGD